MKQYRYSILGIGLAELLFWIIVGSALVILSEFAPHLEWNKSELAIFLGILPVVTLAFIIHLKWKVKAVNQLAESHLVEVVVNGFSAGRSAWRFIIWRLAVACALFGVLGPKVGSKLVEVESKGSNIVVAIDVSNSMMAEDLGPSRLTIAHQTVERLLSKLGSDRVALVVFAGKAYVQCPLTSDYSSLKIFLNAVGTELVSTQGTAIGTAIDVSLLAFENTPENGRSILILTDGENHEDDPVAAAARASEQGATVHILGLASPEGGPVPKLNNRGKKVGFIEDADGRPVVSKLDESTLTATASAGGGIFTRAKRSFIDINPILEEFDKSLKTKSTDIRFTDYDHKFQFFILLSIIFLLVESITPNPVSKS